MITLFNEKNECCGCEACANICPKKAISMREDKYGFMYPIVDTDLCIECRLCKKVCNFQKDKEYNDQHTAYFAVTKNQNILMNSSSGGIFATIALQFIEENSYIAGAIYDNSFHVKHICSNRKDDVIKMQGSKYVQSSINELFSEIKKLLDNKSKVLFSGTPCQVDGLYGYLQKDYDNLITIDIVCHGVPNSKFFHEYLQYEESKNGKLVSITFRDKQQGWGTKGKIVFDNNKTKKINSGTSEYYYLFNNNCIFRDSCYTCKYASLNRPADITLGDYWGIEKMEYGALSKYDLSKGVSLIICNTNKGNELIKSLCSFFELESTSINNVTKYNHNLNLPSEKTIDSSIYLKKSFEQISLLLKRKMFKTKLKDYVKKFIPFKIGLFLKKFI